MADDIALIRRQMDDLNRTLRPRVRDVMVKVERLNNIVTGLSSMAEENQSAFVTAATRAEIRERMMEQVDAALEEALPEIMQRAVSTVAERLLSQAAPPTKPSTSSRAATRAKSKK